MRNMMYRNGKLQRTVEISDEDLRALLDGTLSDGAKEIVANHVNGPPERLMVEIENWVQEWKLSFVRDAARMTTIGMGTVTLVVCPDADFDGDSYVDCTAVDARWRVGGQTVEFELDSSIEQEVISQWHEDKSFERQGV